MEKTKAEAIAKNLQLEISLMEMAYRNGNKEQKVNAYNATLELEGQLQDIVDEYDLAGNQARDRS